MSSREVFDQPDEKRLPLEGSGEVAKLRESLARIAALGLPFGGGMRWMFKGLRKPKKQMHPCPGCGKPTNGTDQPTPQGRITSEYCFRCVTEGYSADAPVA